MSRKDIHLRRFPEDVWKRVRAAAVMRGISASALVARAVRHYLDTIEHGALPEQEKHDR